MEDCHFSCPCSAMVHIGPRVIPSHRSDAPHAERYSTRHVVETPASQLKTIFKCSAVEGRFTFSYLLSIGRLSKPISAVDENRCFALEQLPFRCLHLCGFSSPFQKKTKMTNPRKKNMLANEQQTHSTFCGHSGSPRLESRTNSEIF